LEGDLKGRHLCGEVKGLLVGAIEEVREHHGVSLECCCKALQLDLRRYGRWIGQYRETGCYGGGKSGPRSAPHGLLPEERGKILEMARREEYGDLSHRQLAVVASEKGVVEVSASTFYREMKKAVLMGKRGKSARAPQVKPEVKVDGPNQVWSWDLTYIPLGPFFVYLFAIIDVYSRKIVGWHLSMNATVKAMKMAWDKALVGEGLLNRWGAPCFPLALSDHGVQMAKKTAKEFFRDLGIKQLFARYQTPEDNSWIESWFRILKYDWLRFKDYMSFTQLERMIEDFIDVYNRLRYHGAIGYVTPDQRHSGEAEAVLEARFERKRLARLRRLEINRNSKNQIQWKMAA
jgi:putative transposase